jgi:hypothetical protein
MNEKFRMLDLFSGIVSPVIIGFQGILECTVVGGVHNRLFIKLLPKKVAVRSLMGSAMTRNKSVINRKNLIYLI